MLQRTQSLNGWWDYRIGEGKWSRRQIPYSDRPVGFAVCKLNFAPDHAMEAGERAFLRFDGITYRGTVSFNGQTLGVMGPYSEYRYEITELLQENNELTVKIEDTPVTFGPAEGWENYSGIIRDVAIDYTPASYITDIFWQTDLSEDLQGAMVQVDVTADLREEGLRASITLTDRHGETVNGTSWPMEKETLTCRFPVVHPELWSPDNPYLYTLTTALYRGDECLYTDTRRVGFKKFEAVDKRFHLNGKPLFILGVCRHDLWGDSGHILTEAQMEEDMRMIKSTGANYVRLVHYPHHKRILDLADEIGLLVSEEPGLWWSNVSDPEIFEGSLEVLRRTVIRGRSHVSIAWWLSFNECIFTPEYLLAAAETCRALDMTHMVSGANCMDIPMTRKYFAECGFDFYTMHPYAPTPDRMLESIRELAGSREDTVEKPLMLTEWGGYHVYENPALMETFIREMIKCWQNPDDAPVLAGASIWYWAEMFEFTRAAPACYDGVLCEGMVDRFRKPKMGYYVFQKVYAELDKVPEPDHSMEIITPSLPDVEYTPIDLTGYGSDAAWDAMEEKAKADIDRFHFKKKRSQKYGPILLEEVRAIGSLPVELLTKPVAVNEGYAPCIAVGKACTELLLIGGTSMPKGWPIGGTYGETAGKLTIRYTDGDEEAHILRNGYEITTATALYGPSRINPTAANAQRVLYCIHDMDREQYVVNLLRIQPERKDTVESVTLTAENGYDLLLYGLNIG